MTGTGPTPAEQHLGDRLAALVDGELGHDTRERVLAHLATCAKCKAEADAQRRLKNVFAQAAPPPPSEGFLARLQGLPGGAATGADDDRAGPFGSGGPGAGRFGPGRSGPQRPAGGVFAVTSGEYGPVPPAGAGGPVLPGGRGAGFRIHEVTRQGAERSAWRGRRFAFAAASAVSFAAIALGGALPTVATVDARGEGSGNNVTPLRTPGQAPSATDGSRRRGSGGGPVRSGERPAAVPLSGMPVHLRQSAAHPFLPASPLSALGALNARGAHHGATAPYAVGTSGGLGGAAHTPLIRPTGPALRFATASGPAPVGGLSPTHLAVPTASALPLSARR
ncbi:anti-sigma factor family protein [Streptomyces sp. HMX112]|uniref:anti-sigma factor family protein n=1 Tax=Streptomyces sp. HMX112 TaxID=3390850 RepID=UPI003A803780